MTFAASPKIRRAGFYMLLIFFACLPIWSVARYFNQDGSPHLYNAFLIVELLKENPAFTDVYALNPAPLPNLSGHYLLAFLTLLFSPATVTKIMVSVLFAAFVWAVGWLRRQVIGAEDFCISLLLGAALAFNWMWFLGFYNFIIGVIGYAFTLGLYWRWRENLNFVRSLILSFLLIIVFFSHLISFAMTAGSVLLFCLFVSAENLKRALLWTLAAFVPVAPLVVQYKLTSGAAGGGFSPVWRALKNPFSPADWLAQMLSADPFQMLSRKAFPFYEGTSVFLAAFSPSLWVGAALICLAAATFIFYRRHEFITRRTLPFLLIVGGSITIWIFAPDDFGKTHGGFLRERILLCGLICFVPLFRTGDSVFLKRAAAACLIFVVFFQTLALWNYALDAGRAGEEFLSGESLIRDEDSFASIVLTDGGCRYKANPLPSLGVLCGFGKRTRVWDNYETGYYLFPTILKDSAERRFVNDFREASNFDLCDRTERVGEKFADLDSILDLNNDKIKVLLVWGDDERIAPLLGKWYEAEPYFRNGRVRLFRHR